MHLSQGEYSQFSIRGRLSLLQEFGMPIREKMVQETRIEIYLLYGFYVEVIYENDQVITAEPFKFPALMDYYNIL